MHLTLFSSCTIHELAQIISPAPSFRMFRVSEDCQRRLAPFCLAATSAPGRSCLSGICLALELANKASLPTSDSKTRRSLSHTQRDTKTAGCFFTARMVGTCFNASRTGESSRCRCGGRPDREVACQRWASAAKRRRSCWMPGTTLRSSPQALRPAPLRERRGCSSTIVELAAKDALTALPVDISLVVDDILRDEL